LQLALLGWALAVAQGAASAGEHLVEINGLRGTVSGRLPPDTLGVELVTQRAGACRFGRTWGYDERTWELWAKGCWGTFVVFTSDAPVAGAMPPGAPPSPYLPPPGAPPGYRGAPPGIPVGLYPGSSGREGPIRGPGGLCLDMRGDRVAQGTEAILYRCHGKNNQHFVWTHRGELIVGSLCLDVAGGSSANGTRVVAWPCNGGRHQKWFLNGTQIQSRQNGKCLDVAGGNTKSGTAVIVFDCHGGKNQRWAL
jgi:hypothetical protein